MLHMMRCIHIVRKSSTQTVTRFIHQLILLCTVSYTHLDVYKRQQVDKEVLDALIEAAKQETDTQASDEKYILCTICL